MKKKYKKTESEDAEFRRARRTRFLIDENVEDIVVRAMDVLRFRVNHVRDEGLGGVDDSVVFDFCWRNEFVLVTHDDDFLDDRKFPFYRCPGVIVFPDLKNSHDQYIDIVYYVFSLFDKGGDIWQHTKISVTTDMKIKLRTWNKAEGRILTWNAGWKDGEFYSDDHEV